MGRERAFFFFINTSDGLLRSAVPKCRGSGSGSGSQRYFAPVAMGSILPSRELPDVEIWVSSGVRGGNWAAERAAELGRPFPCLASAMVDSVDVERFRGADVVRMFIGGASVVRRHVAYVTERWLWAVPGHVGVPSAAVAT